MGGTSVPILKTIWSILCAFPDLIQEAAAADKKDLQVGRKKATLGVGLWSKEEMYVFI